MSSQYTIFLAHVQSVHYLCCHVQSIYYIFYPCPVILPPLLPIYQSEFHISCLCPASTSSLLPLSSQNTTLVPMSNQNTISPTRVYTAKVQPVHHLSCQWPVKILPPHPMSRRYTIYLAYVQSVHYLSCPSSVIMPSYLAMSEYHLYYPFPDITPSLLPMLCLLTK